MTNHRTRRKLRATQAPAAVVDAALVEIDQERLAPHGDWVIPGGVRRLQRHYVHDRMFAAGRISPAEWQVGSDYSDDYARASGAVERGNSLEYVDGSTSGGPSDAVVAAISRRRRAHERIGRQAGVLLDAALGEGWSVVALAARFAGGEGGAARERVERMVAIALEALAGGRTK